MNEQFSAFLDGEASRDEADSVVSALLRDETLRQSWSRQHWVRTALRAHASEVDVPLDAGFSGRVMQAIAAQDGEHASNRRSDQTTVVPITRSRPARRRRWRGMAGLAAVASTAGVALLISNSLQQGGTSSSDTTAASAGAPVATASAVGAAPGGTRVVASNSNRHGAGTRTTAAERGPADHWSVSDPALEDELNSYLVEHNGLSRGYGLSATSTAFVRVATYGQEPAQ